MNQSTKNRSDPWFVIISDIHFNIETLEVATGAFRLAAKKARQLSVPLIISGDLNDTKAIIRGEVCNRLTSLFANYRTMIDMYVLIGNHDLINEKRPEHTLNFLRPYCKVIDTICIKNIGSQPLALIPYTHSSEDLAGMIDTLPKDITVVMHQGIKGAKMGEYVIDESSIDPSKLGGRKVFSGHYHMHQVIGNIVFVGNPFTKSAAEASDPSKGFLVVNRDSTFIRIDTNLRKHLVYAAQANDLASLKIESSVDDRITLKLHGSRSELSTINVNTLKSKLNIAGSLKLELNYSDSFTQTPQSTNLTQVQVLDMIIDNSNSSNVEKYILKEYWRKLIS